MDNAVFLCGECGKYFSSISEIREHSCWGKNTKSVELNKPPFILNNGGSVLSEFSGSIVQSTSSSDESPVQLAGQCYSYVDDGKWSEDAVKCLIHLYKCHEADFRKPEKRKREVWETIALELNQEGHIFTTEQVDTKWRNLKKAYWRSKEAQSEIGCPPKFCYEDLLDEVFGQYFPEKLRDKSTNPRVLACSLKGPVEAAKTSQPVSSASTCRGIKRLFPFHDINAVNKSILKTTNPGTSNNSTSGKLSEESTIVDILKTMQNDQKIYEDQKKLYRQEKLRLTTQMHEEKMSLLKELVEVMASSCNRKSPFGD